MLRSMTGFGIAHAQVEGVEYTAEVRSVNSRYLKASVKLPEAWAAAETDFEKILRSRLRRGSVTLTVRMKLPDDQAAYRVNAAVLGRYVEQLRSVADDPMVRVELSSLLELPGVCDPPPLEELCRQTRAGLEALIGLALDDLIAMREREGQAVGADLLSNCDAIGKSLAVVSDRAPGVLVDYRQRLTARVAELTHTGEVSADPDRIAREVAIFAERCDVAEEISRLTGHVAQFRAAMEDDEPSGRKLDFIAQEMLREANTIASKANDAEMGRAVVEIKTAVDRIKEQVQNLE